MIPLTKYIYTFTLICISVLMQGCIIDGIKPDQIDPPPDGYKEARCFTVNGQGRYGTFTQYIKGTGDFFKLTLFGDFPEDTSIDCGKDGLNIKINSHKKKDEEAWRSMDNDVTYYNN